MHNRCIARGKPENVRKKVSSKSTKGSVRKSTFDKLSGWETDSDENLAFKLEIAEWQKDGKGKLISNAYSEICQLVQLLTLEGLSQVYKNDVIAILDDNKDDSKQNREGNDDKLSYNASEEQRKCNQSKFKANLDKIYQLGQPSNEEKITDESRPAAKQSKSSNSKSLSKHNQTKLQEQAGPEKNFNVSLPSSSSGCSINSNKNSNRYKLNDDMDHGDKNSQSSNLKSKDTDKKVNESEKIKTEIDELKAIISEGTSCKSPFRHDSVDSENNSNISSCGEPIELAIWPSENNKERICSCDKCDNFAHSYPYYYFKPSVAGSNLVMKRICPHSRPITALNKSLTNNQRDDTKKITNKISREDFQAIMENKPEQNIKRRVRSANSLNPYHASSYPIPPATPSSSPRPHLLMTNQKRKFSATLGRFISISNQNDKTKSDQQILDPSQYRERNYTTPYRFKTLISGNKVRLHQLRMKASPSKNSVKKMSPSSQEIRIIQERKVDLT
ncbi:uncharacterized protein TRIADDRAFT_58804 [Trichoplax adhaerens]|uniref:Uncharacterized protein n=1 Tax=Trichoplax adhaerens TaxID=10228 RepID=B3S3Q2_TRIAD|nr:predicted protein [Trichoplax adhaerens]EDV22320.1 predicted protein [Trichoplax adhaerens]|eukprot:XP_002114864.1 predicted protein [Trichoplax adhaerens]